jgi:alpha-glucosidase
MIFSFPSVSRSAILARDYQAWRVSCPRRIEDRTMTRGRSLLTHSLLLVVGFSCSAALGAEIPIVSPDGAVRCVVSFDQPGPPALAVSVRGNPVLEHSPLVMTLDRVALTAGARLEKVEEYEVDETYATRGVHSQAVNRAHGARIALTNAVSLTSFTLEVRAANDGAAFRFIVPPGGPQPRVPDESTAFALPAGTTVWSHELRGHYEAQHDQRDIAEIPAGRWAAPPVTFKLPGGAGYGSITEAALVNYSGMALQADGRRGFEIRLAHKHPASYPFTLRYGEAEAQRLSQPAAVSGTITTPWRVVLIGADLDKLVNSDLVANLCPPPDPTLFPKGIATDWIKPGRAVWEYLDGRKSTLEESRQFSRMAGELGFEYNVLEGFWRRFSDDELRGLVRDSRERGVGLWLWRHSKELRDAESRRAFFQKCQDLGIAGVKLDFFDHEAKEMIDFYQTLLRECAEHHLMVNFHGSNKPTGELRTWPNELTREAVRGMESKALKERARHDTTLPFTRLLAGHADYTPVHFGERRGDTSLAHQIASAAILTSPLLTYAASPRTILAQPELAVRLIKGIPSTWDETIVLPPSEIGTLAVFARRSGTSWFLAVLNGPEPRTITVPLAVLGPGEYTALMVRDHPDGLKIEESRGRSGQEVIELSAGGGFLARYSPTR